MLSEKVTGSLSTTEPFKNKNLVNENTMTS